MTDDREANRRSKSVNQGLLRANDTMTEISYLLSIILIPY